MRQQMATHYNVSLSAHHGALFLTSAQQTFMQYETGPEAVSKSDFTC